MLRRNSLALALALLAAACGSSDASQEDLGTTEEALSDCTDTTLVCEDDETPPEARVVKIVSWDGSLGALTYSDAGVVRTATVLPATRVWHAPLARFDATDPVRPLAEQWNALISPLDRTSFGPTHAPLDRSVISFARLTESLANAGAHMRVKIKPNNTVKALRPIP
jgi:hypothetical protein